MILCHEPKNYCKYVKIYVLMLHVVGPFTSGGNVLTTSRGAQLSSARSAKIVKPQQLPYSLLKGTLRMVLFRHEIPSLYID